MNRKISIIGLALFFTLSLFSLVFAQETLTITTYYPSPYGTYNELMLYPHAPATTSCSGAIQEGLMYYNLATHNLNVCRYNGTSYAWEAIGFWAASGNDIYNTNTGNVNIGTMAYATAKLNVAGNIKALLNVTEGTTPVRYGPEYEIGIGNDLAELFEANEEVEPGDVLCIAENGKLKKNTVAYDTKVAGVVSEAPAILFEGSQLQIAPQPFQFKGGSKPPLTLAGRVRCKVIVQETGPIKTGDLLVTSSKPGFATKADTKKLGIGTVLGKALEPLNKGEGKILILATLQ